MMSVYRTLTSISTVLHASYRIYAKRNFASARFPQPQKQLLHHVRNDVQYSQRNEKYILQMFPKAKMSLKNVYNNLKDNFDSSCKFQETTVVVGKVQNQRIYHSTITTNWPKPLVFSGYGFKKLEAQRNVTIKILEYLYEGNYITPIGYPVTMTRKKKQEIYDEWSRLPEITLPPHLLEEGWSIIEKFKKELHQYLGQENELTSCSVLDFQEDSCDERFSNESDEDYEIDYNEQRKDFICKNESLLDLLTGREYIVNSNASRLRSCQMKSQHSELLRFRENAETKGKPLPISEYKDNLERALDTHQVVIIAGDTGCGKSTQVPQMILDKWIEEGRGGECNILISQPRQISAVSLAKYVARERREKLGESVGYHVRLNYQCLKNRGGMMFLTTGMLLQGLISNPSLEGVSHVIVDEIHERSVQIEMLLIILRRLIRNNENLKLILMSASLKVDELQEYFEKDESAFIKVPGAVYPLTRHYLESLWGELNLSPERYDLKYNQYPIVHLDLVLDVIKAIDSSKPPGAILCFLPGWQDIRIMQKRLQEDRELRGRLLVLPLHSRFSSSEQERIFHAPPLNIRKVVLSTNIAETSLTVEDVVYVIDTGCQKEIRYDSMSDCSVLSNHWISKSSGQQRAGRAGRVQAGEVFHLYPEYIYQTMTSYSVPEIMRVPLEHVILQCKGLGAKESAFTFLSEAMSVPSFNLIQKAKKNLVNLGMLSIDTEQLTETLTALGRRVVHFSTPPHLSKALIYSSIFKCVDSVSRISAILSNSRGIFFNSIERRSDIKKIKLDVDATSDLLAELAIIQQWETSSFPIDYCIEHQLETKAAKLSSGVKNLYEWSLKNAFMVDGICGRESKWSINSQNSQLVLGVLLAGVNQILYLQKGIISKGILRQNKTVFKTLNDTLVKTGSDGVFHNIGTDIGSDSRHLLCVKMMKDDVTRRTVARDLSLLHPLTVVLFGGHSLMLKKVKGDNVLTIDNQKNASFLVDSRTGRFIKNLRDTLDQMVSFVLETRGLDLPLPVNLDSLCDELVQYVSTLLEDKEIRDRCEMPRRDD